MNGYKYLIICLEIEKWNNSWLKFKSNSTPHWGFHNSKPLLPSLVFFTGCQEQFLFGCCRQSEGFPGGASGKESDCQCRRRKRRGFNPWVRKIPGGWQPTPVFLPGKSHGQEPGGLQSKGSQSQTRLKWLSMHSFSQIVRDQGRD